MNTDELFNPSQKRVMIHRDRLLILFNPICRLLLTFAANFGKETEGKTKLNIKISQQFISEMLGVTRGTTIKVINKLKELNLIEQTNGYYYIKDLQRLKNHLVEITT